MAPEEIEDRKTNPKAENSPKPETPASDGRPGPARIIFPVVIGLLIVAAIALFAKTRSQSAKLEEEARARQIAQEQAADLERDLSDRLRELNDISDQLRMTEAVRGQLQEEVVELRAGRTQLQSRVETLQNQNESLDERLQAEQASLAELRQDFQESRDAQKRYLEQIEKLLEDKSELQDRLARKPAVDMPGLLVTDGREDFPALRGTILKVNSDYDFVVINRGSGDGVVAGVRFRVLDDDQEVGEVTATRVLPDMTVADINPALTHRQLKTGFTVLVDE
ncbi:MAG: hypothetical protein P9M08_02135 [Candidatus Erginobacter occultus]|nr:hypothetical protein [Candidatus Erginobacter occultus]